MGDSLAAPADGNAMKLDGGKVGSFEGAQPMFSCHDTPNLSATQANSLLKP